MSDLVIVKLGGAMLTEKAGHESLRPGALASAAIQLRAAAATLRGRLVVAHGSGSFAHVAAAESGFTHDPTPLSTALVAAAARRLNAIVVDALIAEGLPAVGLPGAALVSSASGGAEAIRGDIIADVLGAQLLPVVYGDAVPDQDVVRAIISTEALIAGIARSLGASRIILATDVDGVYAAGAGAGEPIKALTPSAAVALVPTLGSAAPGTVDVTGGMAGKVLAMAELVADVPGVEVWIVNGARPGMLLEALTGTPRVGTRIAAEPRS